MRRSGGLVGATSRTPRCGLRVLDGLELTGLGCSAAARPERRPADRSGRYGASGHELHRLREGFELGNPSHNRRGHPIRRSRPITDDHSSVTELVPARPETQVCIGTNLYIGISSNPDSWVRGTCHQPYAYLGAVPTKALTTTQGPVTGVRVRQVDGERATECLVPMPGSTQSVAATNSNNQPYKIRVSASLVRLVPVAGRSLLHRPNAGDGDHHFISTGRLVGRENDHDVVGLRESRPHRGPNPCRLARTCSSARGRVTETRRSGAGDARAVPPIQEAAVLPPSGRICRFAEAACGEGRSCS